MPSVSRANLRRENKPNGETTKQRPHFFLWVLRQSRTDVSRADPRGAEQVKNNLKKIKKVLKST